MSTSSDNPAAGTRAPTLMQLPSLNHPGGLSGPERAEEFM